MFRPMRRFKQQIDEEECRKVLREARRGVLSVLGDDGYPYGVPLDHWLDEETGHLYFHCGKEGHKLDAIRACDKASYCVMDEGHREGDDWPLHFRSVIVFGQVRVVDDEEAMRHICRQISLKFTQDEEYIAHEMTFSFPRVCCLELVPEHMTGKRVKES